MTNILKRTSIRAKFFTVVLAILCAIALPQVFHAIGLLTGTGTSLGAIFLPMQIPVLLAGFMGGPLVGFIAGAASPLISFAIAGMPTASVLPFMMLELVGYGLVGGLLYKTDMPIFLKLIITQISGRVLRAVAVCVAVIGFGSQAVQLSQIWDMIIIGLPGIILQWVVIPLLLYWMRGLNKYYE